MRNTRKKRVTEAEVGAPVPADKLVVGKRYALRFGPMENSEWDAVGTYTGPEEIKDRRTGAIKVQYAFRLSAQFGYVAHNPEQDVRECKPVKA